MILDGIYRIIPIIQKMVEAKEGKIDVDFFKNIILKEEKIEKKYLRNGCIGRYKWEKYNKKYINGWNLNFFGYTNKSNLFNKPIRFSGDKVIGEEINNLPNQILKYHLK